MKSKTKHRLFHPRHYLPPLDIGYCASLLEQRGHETVFFDTALGDLSYEDIVNKVTRSFPKGVVVIRPNEMTYALALRLAKDLKNIREANLGIFFIGPVVSASPEYFVFSGTPVDLCIIGEPEYTLLEAVERSVQGKGLDCIKGTANFTKGNFKIAKSRDYITDLDSLLFPKPDFFIGKGYMFYYPIKMGKKKKLGLILSSRGCPNSCTFCSPLSRVSYGKPYRVRSVQNVVDEIKLLESLGVNLIYFLDDLFSYDKNRLERLCFQMKESKLKIKWAAQCRVDDLNKDLLRLMKSAGCACLNLGIESGSEKVLNILNKNLDLKNIEKVVRNCRQVGISTVGNFILGTPGEGDAERDITVEFAKKVDFDIIEVLLFTPYPGSQAFKEHGCFDKIDQYCRYEKLTQERNDIDNEKVEKFRKHFYKSYYLRPKFLFRNLPLYIYSAILNGRNEWRILKKVIRYIIS